MNKTKYFWYSIIQIFVIFVLPMLLLYFGVIPIAQRIWVGVPILILIIISIYKEKWSLKKVGIRIDNLKSAFIPYLIFTIVGVGALLLIAKLTGKHQLPDWWSYPHFQFLFIPVSFFQEFFFRGFLMPKLQSIFSSNIVVIIVNALLFTLLHIIFPNSLFMLPLAFIGGLAFATIYRFYPNLILISIAHIILNFVAVLYCFFSFATSC